MRLRLYTKHFLLLLCCILAFAGSRGNAQAPRTTPPAWAELAWQAASAEAAGEHRKSLEIANEALKLARADKSDFEVGRSLILVALATRSLGFYDLAVELLRQAVDIGSPEGKITIVPVWGYAAQELGATYFQRGELESATTQLEATYNFATEHQISVGIAEGGSHLSEIWLRRGDREKAQAYAEQALQAARSCDCSSLNTARAMVSVARVSLANAKYDPALLPDTRDKIEAALSFAESNGTKRYVAEAKILLSQALPASEIDQKIALAGEAYELLDANEDELRGTAQANIGSVLSVSGQRELAEFYLKSGFKINRELFRKLDNSFILNELAAGQNLKEQDRQAAKSLKKSAEQALESGAWPLALKSSQQLATLYTAAGYFKLGYKWTETALESLGNVRAMEKHPAALRELAEQELQLRQQLFNISAFFSLASVTQNSPDSPSQK